MNTIHYTLTLVLLLLVVSCDRIQLKINQLSDKIEIVEQSDSDLNSDTWSQIELLMNELENDIKINRTKYTELQIKNFNNLKGRYTALKIKRELRDLKNSIKDFGGQLEGVVEGLMEDSLK